MKIVKRKEFLSLPANTLFSKYSPCYFRSLEIKGDSLCSNDFFTNELASSIHCDGSDQMVEILSDAEKTGKSIEIDLDTEGRDGLFDDEQLFAIWETKDIEKLIIKLEECKSAV